MKTRVLMATVGAAAAALAAGVMWTGPSASANTPYCDGLPPRDAHECNCGFDFAPGSQELHDCMYGNAAAPGPAAPAAPGPAAPAAPDAPGA
jgi:hypothetical protein